MEIYCSAKPFLPFLLHPPSPFLHHKLAKKPVHKLSNLNLTQLPSGTQQLIVFCQLLPLFVPFFSPPVKTGVSVPVEKGSPDSALMTLFMDKKKCHFQWDSSNFPGILQGPNGNLWRERNYLPFAASCFLWRSISPALIRMTRIFFLLACRYCIPLPGYSSRKGHCFQWELPKEGPKGVSALSSEAYSDTLPVLSSIWPVILHYPFPSVSEAIQQLLPVGRVLAWVLGADGFADDGLSCFLGTLYSLLFW